MKLTTIHNIRTVAIVLKLVLITVVVFILSSCSASWHLQRAINKGAKVTTDSAKMDIPIPGEETDSTLHYKQLAEAYKKRNGELLGGMDPTFDDVIHDTIINETTRWKVKTKIDSITKTFYQDVYIKPDTIVRMVPTETDVSADTVKIKIIYASVGAGVIILLLILIAYIAGRWKK